MGADERVGQLIRATHRHGYKYGEDDPWGVVLGAGSWDGRDVYVVQFNDRELDLWPVLDPSDSYEFRLSKDLASASITATEDIPSSIPQQET